MVLNILRNVFFNYFPLILFQSEFASDEPVVQLKRSITMVEILFASIINFAAIRGVFRNQSNIMINTETFPSAIFVRKVRS